MAFEYARRKTLKAFLWMWAILERLYLNAQPASDSNAYEQLRSPEADFLDEIQRKALRVFLLAYSNATALP